MMNKNLFNEKLENERKETQRMIDQLTLDIIHKEKSTELLTTVANVGDFSFPLTIASGNLQNTSENRKRFRYIRMAVLPIDMPRLAHLQDIRSFRIGITKQNEQSSLYDIPHWVLDYKELPEHIRQSDFLTLEDAEKIGEEAIYARLSPRRIKSSDVLLHISFLKMFIFRENKEESLCIVFGAYAKTGFPSATSYKFKNVFDNSWAERLRFQIEHYMRVCHDAQSLRENRINARDYNFIDLLLKDFFYTSLQEHYTGKHRLENIGTITGVLAALLDAKDLPERIANMRPMRMLTLLPEDFNPEEPVIFPIPVQEKGIRPDIQNMRNHWYLGISILLITPNKGITLIDESEFYKVVEGSKDPLLYLELMKDETSLFTINDKEHHSQPLSMTMAQRWAADVTNDNFQSMNMVFGCNEVCQPSDFVYLGAYPTDGRCGKRLNLIFGFSTYQLRQLYWSYAHYPVNEFEMKSISMSAKFYEDIDLVQKLWKDKINKTHEYQFGDAISALMQQDDSLRSYIKQIDDGLKIQKEEKRINAQRKNQEWEVGLKSARRATYDVTMRMKEEEEHPFSYAMPSGFIDDEIKAWLKIRDIPRHMLTNDEILMLDHIINREDKKLR